MRTMSETIDLLLFDLDGTLADTKEDLATAVNLTLREFGVPEHPRERIYEFVGDKIKVRMAEPGKPTPKQLIVPESGSTDTFIEFMRVQ